MGMAITPYTGKNFKSVISNRLKKIPTEHSWKRKKGTTTVTTKRTPPEYLILSIINLH